MVYGVIKCSRRKVHFFSETLFNAAAPCEEQYKRGNIY